MKKILVILALIGAVTAVFAADPNIGYDQINNGLNKLDKSAQGTAKVATNWFFGFGFALFGLIGAILAGAAAWRQNKQAQGNGLMIFVWAVVGFIVGTLAGFYFADEMANNLVGGEGCGFEFMNIWWREALFDMKPPAQPECVKTIKGF